ncbi:MAG: multicopper oxidase domain-containing protein [Pseudotabrizicola sp.]|nr:multicopper oxidase domain-containing protein [Pseudotabrizicola sp.]MDO8884104.1 multicopper oxidase domain-containing protein [Pseudotabrizicola sp.]MDP2081578.1 multicopper oxidase domain-containing protein [Pseudotabrizicola sp.]MDZ7576338.1 multicopper oxidase domain-containing protein [Pseudotabrizicola sp.]
MTAPKSPYAAIPAQDRPQADAAPQRDTVQVLSMATVTVAVDAGEAARWMLYCHHMPHLSTGMMTEFAVSA